MSINELASIFYSNGAERNADYSLLNDVEYLLSEKFLKLEIKKLFPISVYHDSIDKIGTAGAPLIDLDGGGKGHMALKHIAKNILLKSGETHVAVEQEYRGYRPDVMTKDARIIVECGTVNPDKIFGYFSPPEMTNKFIIIPYPYEGDETLTQYTFTPGEELGEFIEFLKLTRLGKVRSSKNKTGH